MRIAAGILMIIVAIASLVTHIFARSDFLIYPLSFNLFVFISAAFLVTGGGFCLKRKYWGFCLASALLLLLILYLVQAHIIIRLIWLDWYFVAPAEILPIIFVCVRKREWSESQA